MFRNTDRLPVSNHSKQGENHVTPRNSFHCNRQRDSVCNNLEYRLSEKERRRVSSHRWTRRVCLRACGGCTMGYLKRRFRMIPIMSSTYHTTPWLRSFVVIPWITPACQPLPVSSPSYFWTLAMPWPLWGSVQSQNQKENM